jgi:hypothetical protein
VTRRAGRLFREVVDGRPRRELVQRGATVPPQASKIRVRDLGDLKPGLALDNIAELVEQVEGPLHR